MSSGSCSLLASSYLLRGRSLLAWWTLSWCGLGRTNRWWTADLKRCRDFLISQLLQITTSPEAWPATRQASDSTKARLLTGCLLPTSTRLRRGRNTSTSRVPSFTRKPTYVRSSSPSSSTTSMLPLPSPTNAAVRDTHSALTYSKSIFRMSGSSLEPSSDSCRKETDLCVRTARMFLVSATSTISRTEEQVLRAGAWSASRKSALSGHSLTSVREAVSRWLLRYSSTRRTSPECTTFFRSRMPPGSSQKQRLPLADPPTRQCQLLHTARVDSDSARLTLRSGSWASCDHTERKLLLICWASSCWLAGQQARPERKVSSRYFCSTAVVLGSKRKNSRLSCELTSRHYLEDRIIFNFIQSAPLPPSRSTSPPSPSTSPA